MPSAVSRHGSVDGRPEDALPTQAQMKKAADVTVFNGNREPVLFSALCDASSNEDFKHLFIFIRHFFCGLCQDYTTTVCAQLPPSSLPPSTAISFIGCGSADLIQTYAAHTGCQYPIYADPSHKLYDIFHMNRTLDPGHKRPDYQINGMPYLVWKGIYQSLSSGAAIFKGGHHFQLGGEILYQGERVIWAHRMTTTRSHTEVHALKKLLEVA